MTAPNPLLERLVRVGKVAGRDELAKLAYQMARSCWSAATETKARHIRWFKDPRSVTALYTDLLLLEARTGLTLEKDELPLADPTAESAITSAHACLDLGVQIEGDSPRLQLLRAKCIRADGGLEEAADRMDTLLKGQLTKSTYQVLQENRQTAFLALRRFEEVAEIGKTLLGRDSKRPDAAFNTLTAQAWMGMESEFRESAIRFQLALDGTQDTEYWTRLIADEASWLAGKFRRDPSEVRARLMPSASSPSSQRPGS